MWLTREDSSSGAAVAPLAAGLRRQRLARRRQTRLRDRAAVVWPLVVVVGIPASVALGFVGYLDVEGGNVLDALYRSLSLFGLGSANDARGSAPLDVARFLAPAMVGYAALAGVYTVFRGHLRLSRVHLLARRHVVVIGLGDRGWRLLSALDAAGLRAVGVEVDRTAKALASADRRSIPVVVGSGDDAEILRRARVDRAAHVVACCDDDASNLRVLSACAAVRAAAHPSRLTAHVLLRDAHLWRRLQGAALQSTADRTIRVDFVNTVDLAARALVSTLPAVLGHHDRARVAVTSGTELGRRVARNLARVAEAERRFLTIVLISDDPAADGRAADLTPSDWFTIDAAAEPSGSFDAIYVCARTGEDNLRLALELRDALAGPMLVAVEDDELGTSMADLDLHLRDVIPVGVTSRVFGPALLLGSVVEAIAQARHACYLSLELRRGRHMGSDPSLVPWEQLPESLKESNRRFAEDVGRLVARLGGTIEPLRGQLQSPLDIPAELLEDVAAAEHRRWSGALRRAGWRYAPGAKDPERKLHPLLVDWEELPEYEREKDREPIRRLGEILRVADYAIVLPSPGPRVAR